RQVDALAGDVVLPPVIRTAQARLLVPPEPQRDAAVRAELVDQADPPLRVAEGHQRLGEQLDPHPRAGWRPDIAPRPRADATADEVAHQRARSGAGQLLVPLLRHAHACALTFTSSPSRGASTAQSPRARTR